MTGGSNRQRTKHANSPVALQSMGRNVRAVSASVACGDCGRARAAGAAVKRGRGFLFACACMALAPGAGPAGAALARRHRLRLRAADATPPPADPAVPGCSAAASWSVLRARPAATASCVPAASDSDPNQPEPGFLPRFLARRAARCLFLRGGDTPESNRKGSASRVSVAGLVRGWVAVLFSSTYRKRKFYMYEILNKIYL